MSLNAIELVNFRGFRQARIELKALTVLLGPNSAGKSSWGHALAGLAHAHYLFSGASERTLTLTPSPNNPEPWPVDLGNWDDLRTTNRKGRVCVRLSFGSGIVTFGFGLNSFSDLRLSYIAYPKRSDHSYISSTTTQSATPVDSSAISGALPAGGVTTLSPLYELERQDEANWREISAPGKPLVGLSMNGLVLRYARHMPGGTAIDPAGESAADVASLLERLTYLQGVRSAPQRKYPRTTTLMSRQALGYDGRYVASVLDSVGGDLVRARYPPNLPRSADDAKGLLDAPWLQDEGKLTYSLERWIQHIGLATSISTVVDGDWLRIRAKLAGQDAHDITEVGLGVSQALPVVVAGLLQQPGSLFIVDLPEAHLHPRPQAALADFFCGLALSGRQVLIETHSEMFFHRLRLRAEMSSHLREQIAVYFVDEPRDGCCSDPRRIELGYEKELDWPIGFFQEGWKTEVEIDAVRQARLRHE